MARTAVAAPVATPAPVAPAPAMSAPAAASLSTKQTVTPGQAAVEGREAIEAKEAIAATPAEYEYTREVQDIAGSPAEYEWVKAAQGNKYNAASQRVTDAMMKSDGTKLSDSTGAEKKLIAAVTQYIEGIKAADRTLTEPAIAMWNEAGQILNKENADWIKTHPNDIITVGSANPIAQAGKNSVRKGYSDADILAMQENPDYIAEERITGAVAPGEGWTQGALSKAAVDPTMKTETQIGSASPVGEGWTQGKETKAAVAGQDAVAGQTAIEAKAATPDVVNTEQKYYTPSGKEISKELYDKLYSDMNLKEKVKKVSDEEADINDILASGENGSKWGYRDSE